MQRHSTWDYVVPEATGISGHVTVTVQYRIPGFASLFQVNTCMLCGDFNAHIEFDVQNCIQYQHRHVTCQSVTTMTKMHAWLRFDMVYFSFILERL